MRVGSAFGSASWYDSQYELNQLLLRGPTSGWTASIMKPHALQWVMTKRTLKINRARSTRGDSFVVTTSICHAPGHGHANSRGAQVGQPPVQASGGGGAWGCRRTRLSRCRVDGRHWSGCE